MKNLTLAATAALLLSGSAGLAQTYDLYHSNPSWNVFHNTATNGCFMERVTDNGFVLQIGSLQSMLAGEGTTVGAYMGVYAPGERPEGTTDANLAIKLGPHVYSAKSHSVERDGYWGGYFVSEGDQDLAFDVKNRKTMEILSSNNLLVKIDLTATAFNLNQAIAETEECQAKFN